MRTRIIIMISFFLTTVSLLGQVDKDIFDNYDKFNYIDSDIRNITKSSQSLINSVKSLNKKTNHNSKDFFYQDNGPHPSLKPEKARSNLGPVQKEKKFKRNLYYPPSIYSPEYPIRDTIKSRN